MMILNPELAKSVREAWIEDQEHPHRGRDKLRSYPDESFLAEVLDAAFRASLLSEEGKQIRGSLTLLSPNELKTLEIPRRREAELVVRFRDERELDVEVVAKLAMATTVGSSSLLIRWDNNRCKIWGIIYYSKRSLSLSQIPFGFPEGRYLPPDSPTIEIIGAGMLRIIRSDSVIGRIDKGVFEAAVPTPFTSWAMGRFLFDLFELKTEGNKFSTERDSLRWMVITSCLDYLFSTLDQQGWGATIIFVPDSSMEQAKTNLDLPLNSEGSLNIEELIDTRIRYTQTKSSLLSTIAVDKELRGRLESLVRLASLDGALLLKPNFDLIGFGVKLFAPDFKGQVQTGQDGFGRSRGLIDFKRFGMRHNSALRFIASVSGSVGFVASEDGPIRGLTKVSDEAVNCWPDCRVSMFA